MRTFLDSRGMLWEVSVAFPQHGDVRALRFTSRSEIRALGDVPPGWEQLDDEALEALCRRAIVIDRGNHGP